MRLQREWITPITAGTFLISAATGLLMFFHVETGLVKTVHEWTSWIFVAGAGLHLVVNLSGIKRLLRDTKGIVIIACCCLVLLVSFLIPGNSHGGSPVPLLIERMADAPLATLAVVADLDNEQLQARLSQAGISYQSDQQSLREIVQNPRDQFRILVMLLEKQE